MTTSFDTNSTGSGESIDIRQSFGTSNYVIAVEGTFPSRSLSSDPLLGSVAMFAGNFAPRGWEFCNGQVLPISGNETLYAIIGTTYGGDGRTSFALPDLRGRVPIGAGTGPGLEPIRLGQKIGSETATLASTPAHSHSAGNAQTGSAGGATSLPTTMPSLGLLPVVALEGLYPSRSLSIEPGIGDIAWFAGNFAPRGWAVASGQLLPIAQHAALFSLLGTNFGGDGRTTFALPDLRGRIAIGTGSGPGLPPIQLGQRGGSLETTLTKAQLANHSHTQPGSNESTGSTGTSTSVNIQQPWLALNHVVGTSGNYPPRSLDADPVHALTPEPSATSQVLNGNTLISDRQAQKALATLLEASSTIWKDLGATPAQLQHIHGLTVEFADLPGGGLAEVSSSDTIRVDRDAGGRGWFIDPTPHTSSEYNTQDPYTKARAADQGKASQHYDLLTTLLHEQAHILGQNHQDQPRDLMHGSLSIGIRKYPKKHHLLSDHQHIGETHTSSSSLIGTNSYYAAIGLSGYNFTPRNSASASGELIPITQNTALFSLLGTNYGGDGRSTFGLPDFQGRAVIGSQNGAQGPGLSAYNLGAFGGRESVNLISSQLQAHSHSEPSLSDIFGSNLQDDSGETINLASSQLQVHSQSDSSLSDILDSNLQVDSGEQFNLAQPSSISETFTINGTFTNTTKLFNSGEIINNGILVNNSTIINNGTINSINGTLNNNGTISGTGTIQGSILENGNMAPGNSAGGLRIHGHFIKHKGKLKIELGGHRDKKMDREDSHHDFIDIDGDALLGGRLRIKLINDYILKPGKEHKIIDISGEQFGSFKNYSEGDLVKAKRHKGQDLFISYTGGDGNDVVLYTKNVTEPSPADIVNAD